MLSTLFHIPGKYCARSVAMKALGPTLLRTLRVRQISSYFDCIDFRLSREQLAYWCYKTELVENSVLIDS